MSVLTTHKEVRVSLLPRTRKGEQILRKLGTLWYVRKDGSLVNGRKKIQLYPDFFIQEKIRNRFVKGVTYKGMPVEQEYDLKWNR